MNEALITQDLERLKAEIKDMQTQARDLNARTKTLINTPVVGQDSLSANLKSFLPKQFVPGNVGHINKVSWDFSFSVDFNLSQTPDWPNYTSNTRQTNSFQVTQESAFLLMAMSRHCNDYLDGDLAPLTIEIRDRQSSRFFNNFPTPLQMYGQKGYPTIFPTPMFLPPNAFYDVTIGTSLADGVSQNTQGGSSGIIQVSFHGYRVRVEDADKVLSSIFKG